MKTTVEISDAVLNAARELARREKTTVKALVERGLRRELAHAERGTGFRLRRASVKGNGLRTEFFSLPGAEGPKSLPDPATSGG